MSQQPRKYPNRIRDAKLYLLVRRHNPPLTLKEAGERFGMSKNAVHKAVLYFERRREREQREREGLVPGAKLVRTVGGRVMEPVEGDTRVGRVPQVPGGVTLPSAAAEVDVARERRASLRRQEREAERMRAEAAPRRIPLAQYQPRFVPTGPASTASTVPPEMLLSSMRRTSERSRLRDRRRFLVAET